MSLWQVTGVILAGGKSSRMGRNKAELLFADRTLLQCAVEKLQQVCAEVIVVSQTPGQYKIAGVKETTDIYPDMGPLGGMHAGLTAAKYQDVFVTACDMPLWEPEMVVKLLKALEGFDAVVPKIDGYIEPLFGVYTKQCLPAIENCLRKDVRKIIDFYSQVKIRCMGEEVFGHQPQKALTSINTPQDYLDIIGKKMRTHLSLEEAQEILLEFAPVPPEEKVSLPEALNRILSRDMMSRMDVPPFRRSAVDGYAITGQDMERACQGQSVALRVQEVVPAGFSPHCQVVDGTTVKTMTGAPLPSGAAVVVKYEEVDQAGAYIKLDHTVRAATQKKNVMLQGEDIKAGEVIASKGSRVTPSLIGVLAATGHREMMVYHRMKAAIISTGDEILDIHEILAPAKIYNSNLYTLAAYCQDLGIQPVVLGNVADKKEDIKKEITRGLAMANLVITTGGVSVGDFDGVKEALEEMGATLLFWKIKMKPGHPMLAAVKDDKLIVGLSGNPAAAMISYELLVKPLLLKLAGQANHKNPTITASLKGDFPKSSPQRRFLRGKLGIWQGQVIVNLTGVQDSGILKSMVGCNVLVDVPAGSRPLVNGQEVTVQIVERIDALNG